MSTGAGLNDLAEAHGVDPDDESSAESVDLDRDEAWAGDVDVDPPPATGDPGVDDALGRLPQAVALPLEQQLPVFDAVHRTLQDRLADVEG